MQLFISVYVISINETNLHRQEMKNYNSGIKSVSLYIFLFIKSRSFHVSFDFLIIKSPLGIEIDFP